MKSTLLKSQMADLMKNFSEILIFVKVTGKAGRGA